MEKWEERWKSGEIEVEVMLRGVFGDGWVVFQEGRS